jgi:hypothetical protein
LSEIPSDRQRDAQILESEDELIDIIALSNEIYFVLLHVGNVEGPTHEMKVAVDTCSGSNLIRRESLPISCKIHEVNNPPKVSDAQGRILKVEGVAILDLMLGERLIQVPFLVVDDLTVPVLLGSLFSHQHVRALLPPERLIVVWDGIDEEASTTLSFV